MAELLAFAGSADLRLGMPPMPKGERAERSGLYVQEPEHAAHEGAEGLMGARGPAPEGQRKIVTMVPAEYPEPLPGMLAAEKTVWWRIVRAFPESHFRPQHHDLLRAFCEAAAEATRLKKKIKKEGDMVPGFGGVDKAHPLFPQVNAARSFMASASTKLGITNNTATKSKGEKPEKKSKREGLMFESNG